MLNLKILSVICGIELVGAIGNVMGVAAANEILLGGTCLLQHHKLKIRYYTFILSC